MDRQIEKGKEREIKETERKREKQREKKIYIEREAAFLSLTIDNIRHTL